MVKVVLVFFSLTAVLFSCKPARQIQSAETIIAKKDTTPIIAATENKTTDSAKFITDIYNKVINNKLSFTTFEGKARVGYKAKEGGDEATAYIRLQKDSALWISLRGPLGIEGFRVLITKDSVKVMDLLKKSILFRNIGFLNELTGFPFDFNSIQDVVLGNPVFTDKNVIGYKLDEDQLQVMMRGELYRHLLSLDKNDYKILHSTIEDVNTSIGRTCNIDFSGYDNKAGAPFSTIRKISVSQQNSFDVNLEFKSFSFNQPVTFPFNIQKNYKRI